MTRSILTLLVLFGAACTTDVVSLDDDCDEDCDVTDRHDADVDTDADADSDSDSDADSDADTEPVHQLYLTTITPGEAVYGSMICHVSYYDDLDPRLVDNDWGGWQYSWVENWVSSTTIGHDPNMIEGLLHNCTICPQELTLEEEPWGTQAEQMGCTWTGYGSSASESRINGTVTAVYFGETFLPETVFFDGMTGVVVDFR